MTGVADLSVPAAFQAGHAGSIPVTRSTVMSQDIRTPRTYVRVGVFSLASRMGGRWAGSSVGVEDELADELAGVGVDDADVQVLDQDQDAGSGRGRRPVPMWWSFRCGGG